MGPTGSLVIEIGTDLSAAQGLGTFALQGHPAVRQQLEQDAPSAAPTLELDDVAHPARHQGATAAAKLLGGRVARPGGGDDRRSSTVGCWRLVTVGKRPLPHASFQKLDGGAGRKAAGRGARRWAPRPAK